MAEETTEFWFYSREKSFVEVVGRALGPGYKIHHCYPDDTGNKLQLCRQADAILLDASSVGGESYEEVLQLMYALQKSPQPPPPIVVMVPDDEQETIRIFIENGAYETLAIPPDILELRLVLRRAHRYHQVETALSQSQARPQPSGQLGELVGCTESMQHVFQMARKVATCDVGVLITGETGTGKELLARATHQSSQRVSGPFVPFSCANLPETLIDDELFGHEKGAFTGATGMRRGRFEAADHGTLFLDEVGDLALDLQAKLLRVLQERSFERLGSCTPLNADVRVICATHDDLEEMVQDGKFRMDLYFRLNVVQLHLPALRDRREDIPLLAQHFLQQYSKQFNKRIKRVSTLAMQALEEYSWSGNVRELENVIQRAVVLAEGTTIETRHLPERLHNGFTRPSGSSLYEEEVHEFKRRLILRTLRKCKGSRTEGARLLGVSRGCLYRLINQLNIRAEEENLALTESYDEAEGEHAGVKNQ